MMAPKKPDGLEKSVGETMHLFLMRQLDCIIEEEDEYSTIAEHCFSKGMETLYQRGINLEYTKYYEQLFEIANHARQYRAENNDENSG
jgi:hypothetical protein